MKVRKDLNTMEIENLIKIINAVSESELTGLKYEVDGVKPVSYTHLEREEPPSFDFGQGHKAKCWLYHPMAGYTEE